MAPWSTTSPAATALAAELRDIAGVRSPRSKVPLGALRRLGILAPNCEDLPYGVITALLGFEYAVGTGRLAGTIVLQLRALTDWQRCALVAEIATECKVSGEVPQFLISRFVKG